MLTNQPGPISRRRILCARLVRGLTMSLALFVLLWTGVEGQQAPPQRTDADGNRHYDARIAATQGFSVRPLATQTRSMNASTALIPDLMVTYDEKFGVTRSLMNATGYLTLEALGLENRDDRFERGDFEHPGVVAVGVRVGVP